MPSEPVVVLKITSKLILNSQYGIHLKMCTVGVRRVAGEILFNCTQHALLIIAIIHGCPELGGLALFCEAIGAPRLTGG